MTRLFDDAHLDSAIRSVAQPVANESNSTLDSALDDLGHAIVREQPFTQVRPKRRSHRFVAAGVVVAALAVGTPAAASWVGAHTGIFGDSGMSENDTSEWLRLDSPEIDTIVDQKAALYPLPTGGDWSVAKRNLHRAGEPAVMQESGIEMTMAMNAACQWERAWLKADASNNTREQQATAEVLAKVPTWKAIREHDGGGVVDGYVSIATAAKTGNAQLVRQPYNANCASSYGTVEK